MAETFKHYQTALTTANTTIYSCPVGTTAIVFMAQAANKDIGQTSSITCVATDASAGSTRYLARDITMPAKSSVNILGGKLVLEATDSLSANSSSNSTVDLILSILEIS